MSVAPPPPPPPHSIQRLSRAADTISFMAFPLSTHAFGGCRGNVPRLDELDRISCETEVKGGEWLGSNTDGEPEVYLTFPFYLLQIVVLFRRAPISQSIVCSHVPGCSGTHYEALIPLWRRLSPTVSCSPGDTSLSGQSDLQQIKVLYLSNKQALLLCVTVRLLLLLWLTVTSLSYKLSSTMEAK